MWRALPGASENPLMMERVQIDLQRTETRWRFEQSLSTTTIPTLFIAALPTEGYIHSHSLNLPFLLLPTRGLLRNSKDHETWTVLNDRIS